MNDDLVDALKLLRECRISLIQDYTKSNSDRYYYSFRYGKSPASFELARCLAEHQWLDEHFNLASSKYECKEISKASLMMFLNILQRMSIQRLNIQNSSIQQVHNSIKISALEALLSQSRVMDNRLKLIEFDYYRDKVLFEREMEKYMNDIINE